MKLDKVSRWNATELDMPMGDLSTARMLIFVALHRTIPAPSSERSSSPCHRSHPIHLRRGTCPSYMSRLLFVIGSDL